MTHKVTRPVWDQAAGFTSTPVNPRHSFSYLTPRAVDRLAQSTVTPPSAAAVFRRSTWHEANRPSQAETRGGAHAGGRPRYLMRILYCAGAFGLVTPSRSSQYPPRAIAAFQPSPNATKSRNPTALISKTQTPPRESRAQYPNQPSQTSTTLLL